MKVNKIGLISVEGIKNSPNELLLRASDNSGRIYRYYMDTAEFNTIKDFCRYKNIDFKKYMKE